MIDALRDPARYPHPAQRVEVLETHISWVLLAGEYAYKIKKPVALGFLDFSTLQARRFYCDEELRLNRRTAPQLYLEVVPITGSASAPRLGGTGEAIDYAVKMRRFSQDALMSRMAEAGALRSEHIDALAQVVAAFHARVARATAGQPYGSAAEVLAPAMQNFDQIEALGGAGAEAPLLARLRAWTGEEHDRLRELFDARRSEGFVRECHGDLHLGNVALLEGRPTPFDGIEFNESFRWIDVMNEVAFMAMDLADRKLPRLAQRFLNAYLEATGDYPGLAVLRFYMVYRALVRAKVACIRERQDGLAEEARRRAEREHHEYLRLADSLAHGSRPALILMHGLAGSGKTTVAQCLLEALGAVRLRSDVERKRLAGLGAEARSHSALGAGLYTAELTGRAYGRLAELARAILRAGYPAIVDATFLLRAQRRDFSALANDLRVPWAIASCEAPLEVLRERVERRGRGAHDASEAGIEVLEHQIASLEPLSEEERRSCVSFDTRGHSGAAVAKLAGLLRLAVAA